VLPRNDKYMQRKIIFFTIIILLFSFFYLAYTEKKQADLNYQKNWWILSFDNPKDNTLNFSIENHSNKNNFHWEVLADGNIIKEAAISASRGVTKDIDLSDINIKDLENKKISVKVSADGETKEIYKNF
jgi:hypothetical protein